MTTRTDAHRILNTRLSADRGHASIVAFDVTVTTDTYTDDNGEPYTVVSIWPQDDSKPVVIVNDTDVYRDGDFV